jgi:hypothetical protein
VGEAQANDVTVTGVSQIGGLVKPTAVDDSLVMNQRDITLNVSAPGVLANDRDPFGTKLLYRGQTKPANGIVAESTDGSLTYRPNNGFHGIDSWTYRANSPDGRVSYPATIQVRVDPDGTPVASNDHFTTKYQTNFSLNAPGVLANDHDPQQDSLQAKLLTGPSKGIAGISSDGQLSFLPPAHFAGDLTFTYEAIDPAGNHSKPATVTMTVLPNAAPTIAVPDFGGLRITAGNDGLSGTFPLDVSDSESPSGVTVTGTSSNQSVVANSGIKIGPAGDTRQAVTITAKGAKGTAVVTLTASDGEKSTTLKITVMVGANGNDTLTGTAGPDLLIGLNGQDTLNGAGGRDVLTGGAGNDTLTGGAGGDFFRGGAGTNIVTDFTGSQGDEKMEIGS